MSAIAAQQLEQARAWWIKNRDQQALFASALNAALASIAEFPYAAKPYAARKDQGVRRYYIEKLGYHLYYVVDDESVEIVAVWGGRRGSAPIFDIEGL